HQVGADAALAKMVRHRGCGLLAACIQGPVKVVEAGRTQARLGVSQEVEPPHRPMTSNPRVR
ncbi:MAG: hypothetical protein ACKVH0_10720, partial [Alphaproteobacteria bacterium]